MKLPHHYQPVSTPTGRHANIRNWGEGTLRQPLRHFIALVAVLVLGGLSTVLAAPLNINCPHDGYVDLPESTITSSFDRIYFTSFPTMASGDKVARTNGVAVYVNPASGTFVVPDGSHSSDRIFTGESFRFYNGADGSGNSKPGTGSAIGTVLTFTCTLGFPPGSGTSTFTVTITAAPPTSFSAATPATFVAANTAFPNYTFTANGDSPTYTLNSGTLPTGLTLDTTGLLHGTPTATGTFTFTVKAANAGGNIVTPSITITVIDIATNAATSVGASSATLNGSINPAGTSATASFRYGLSTNYGNSAAASPGTVTGSSATAVSANLTGLVAGTYHYCTAATNAGGNTVLGPDQTFTIAATSNVSVLGAPAWTNAGATLSSFTVPAGNNRLLVVAASAENPNGAANALNITGVTFNGNALTLGVKKDDYVLNSSTGYAVDGLFYVALGSSASPTTANIVVTPGTNATVSSIGAIVFQNVDQTTPLNGFQSANSSTANSSLTVTSTTGDMVIDLMDNYNALPVAGTGQIVAVAGPDTLGGALNYAVSLKPGAASVPMAWTSTGGSQTQQVVANIKQAAVIATPAVSVPGGTTTLTTTTFGTPGTSVSFNITGANLTGAPGNLTVTAPSNVQVSANNSTWGSTASIPYSSATLASTPVYVRLAGTGSVGTISGNVSITGGGLASAVTQAVSGTLNAPPPSVTVPGGTTTLTTTTFGTPGTSVSFNITGANLTGAPGNLTVTAPANAEVSANNSTWGSTASIPYSSATLASTPVYVRLVGTGSVGTISGNVSIIGGGLSSAVTQAVSGTLNAAPSPTITNITSSTANGAYRATQSVSIQVSFNASVTVTGTPTLALNSGGSASYASGSPGTTLIFTYNVGAGQTSADLDYSSTSALALAGGTINATTGGTAATLTLPAPGAAGSLGANKAIVVDTTAPTVSIGAPSVSTITAGAGSVTYAVTYADTNFSSSNLTTGGITLNTTGTASGTIGLTGSGTSYTVTISSITGVGTLGITVGANTSLDSAGNANQASSASTTFAVVSNNANLSALALTTATINEAFDANTTSYTSHVPKETSSVTVTATAAQANATIQARVGANAFASVPSGSPSASLALAVGANTIEVKVTAQDGVTQKTYFVAVKRLTYLEGWRRTHFNTITSTGNAADDVAPQNDGLPNLLKFATGMDPTVSGVSPTGIVYNGSTLDFTYPRSLEAKAECTFIVEWSETLQAGSWGAVSVSEQVLSTTGTLEQVKATLPAGTLGRRFVRLRVTNP